MTDLARRLRGRRNTIRGDHMQEVVGHRLRAMGLAMVRRCETGWRVVRAFDPRLRTSRIVGASPLAKVAGDWLAIIPASGRSVLVEVKSRSDDTLALSDFALHVRAALTKHAECNGCSLIGWTFEQRVEILDWTRMRLVKGKPLHIDDEERIAPMRWGGI